MVVASVARADFERARRKAFWRRIAKWFARADDALLSFDDVRKRLHTGAQRSGIVLPPVELYRIGDTYFVKDGNQRVSVARETGQRVIDARVIELDSPAPVSSAEHILALIRDEDAVRFHEATGI